MITREDVAKKAGVSVSAVSRVMNNRGYVAKEKKEAILKAVEELGYRPNPISKILKTKRTNQICYLNTDMDNPVYIDIYQNISFYAGKKGYTVFLLNTFDEKRMKDMLIDGLIIANEKMAKEVEVRLGNSLYIPIVAIAAGLPEILTQKISYANIDTYDAMSMALQYLYERGHEKIAYATPFRKNDTGIIQSKYIAYENIIEAIAGKNQSCIILSQKEERKVRGFSSVNFFEEGIRAADEFHNRHVNVSAVVCFNDEFALGMMLELRKLGYKIPEDLSIMGIDGIKNRKYTEPLLTSISLNQKKLAQKCFDLLCDKMEGKKTPSVVSAKPYLIEGESVRRIR